MVPTGSTVAIVGGGAMGGLWAAKLAAAGHRVTVVDVSPVLLAAVRSDGLTLLEETGETRVTVAATDDTTGVGRVDVAIVFVKGPHTAAAAAALPPLLDERTVVATLQNGWGNADVLARHVPAEQLVVGVTYEGATVVAPAVVRRGGPGPTSVGPYVDGADLGPASTIAELLRSAGFAADATPAVKTDIWRKLIHNSACLPVSALTGLHAAALISTEPARRLIDALAGEAVETARALGHPIELEERIGRIHAVLEAAGDGIPSMLADVLAKRVTEIDRINGAVVRAAGEVGVLVPLNRAMVELVHGLEAGWER